LNDVDRIHVFGVVVASTSLVRAGTTVIKPSMLFQPDQSGASDLDSVDAERSQYLKPASLD
jgi:hypothetical protein